MVLVGGDGPMFFGYENVSRCGSNWLWHMTFLNNIIPWKDIDGCANWTWYVACDMQFFLILPFLTDLYYKDRKRFWGTSLGLFLFCMLFSTIVIFKNDLTASYFTYNNEYWSLFYTKPYARFPGFLTGIIFGCSYFSYKYELNKKDGPEEGQKV